MDIKTSIDKQEENRIKEIDEFCKDKHEKEEKDIRSNITFKLDNSHYITVLNHGKEVGSIWSELGKEFRFPFPHNNEQINKIQICGFDNCSEIWGCGRYEGKKDLVLTFQDYSDKFWKYHEDEYKEYVQKNIKNNNLKNMQSFKDFCRYNCGQEFKQEASK